jgi:hypothetical protein
MDIKKTNIGDESIDYLCQKSGKDMYTILSFIEDKEREILGHDSNYTVFQEIKKSPSFTQECSIRELLGLSVRKTDISNALIIANNLIDKTSGLLMVVPVKISSGLTYEKSYIEEWFQTELSCPLRGVPVRNMFMEDKRIFSLTEDFVSMYKNQKGKHWEKISFLCDTYQKQKEKLRLQKIELEELKKQKEILAKKAIEESKARDIALQKRRMANLSRFNMNRPSQQVSGWMRMFDNTARISESEYTQIGRSDQEISTYIRNHFPRYVRDDFIEKLRMFAGSRELSYSDAKYFLFNIY